MNTVTRATALTAFRDAAAPADVDYPAFARRAERPREVTADLTLSIYSDLDAIEAEWRRFEEVADCTAFQTFAWLSTWHRHVGLRVGARLAIAVGRYGDGATAFILPLCVATNHSVRRLCWLGLELCDYNAPLLARDFSQRVTPDRFLIVWRELLERLRGDPLLRYDWIELEKMPQTIGGQVNPFTYLAVTPNASGAHLTQLGDNWEKFYTAKRSSATRRRDRTKRKHMSAYGDIRFLNTTDQDDARRTIETLMEQKSRSFARKGIADIFARPGRREFYLDLATNPQARHLVHVSRVEIGTTCAAANLGIVFGDCYYHLLASYDDGPLSHYGPGGLHLRELLAHAIGLGLQRFDFTIGDESYKLEWSDTHLELCDYAAAATWRGLPASWFSNARRRAKRFIKQTPWAWRLVSDARTALGSLLRPRAARPHDRGAVAARAAPVRPALACVMGDMDLLRPVVLAGIPCAVVTRPGAPPLYSRYAQSALAWDDFSKNVDGLVDALVSFGKAQPERPILFYEEDAQLLIVSRFRERLGEAFRFVIADAPLVESLLDKAQFQVLAQRHGLPVPPARRFNPAAVDPADLGLRFPVIVKPLTRLERWNETLGLRKAIAAKDLEALRALWPQLLALDIDLIAQELIPGAEAQIESYHCYVDQRGSIAGEFTGRKIRTYPPSYGHTTALEITDTADVQQQGRAIVERLGLTGVAKLDFKRDPQGGLHLLEINPRFNLWHHPGAIAGVNIPALVYADLVGLPRPAATPVKAGIRWCRIWKDFPAAKAAGIPLTTWAPWAFRCERKSALSWDDPMPVLRSALHRLIARHVGPSSTVNGRRRNWTDS
jgi:CelD/BcsL family acetyltransferase involved in cellulose biosynthesis/predicted ATP-grasp superfamily ATP-dependent carboligase